jgi:hypothetical protein
MKHALRCLSVMAASLAGSSSAHALINLEYRSSFQSVGVGSTVNIGIYAVSDSALNQSLSSYQTIFAWDPAFLQLNGFSTVGSVWPGQIAGFYAGGGLNESNPPADGNGLLVSFGVIGSPANATPTGVLLSTLQFTALTQTPMTAVGLIRSAGSPPVTTMIVDGIVPNLDVTGTLSGATVQIIPSPGSAGAISLGVLACGRRRRCCL